MFGHHVRDDAHYLIILHPKRVGPVVGSFCGEDIHERVDDCWGRRYSFAGIIARLPNRHYDRARLKPLEFILEPGIIYRMHVGASPGKLKIGQRLLSRWFLRVRSKLASRARRSPESQLGLFFGESD